MKDINTLPEAVDKIESLIRQLHDVCVENGVPLVIAALVSRTERDINRFLSLYLDGPAGLTDSSLLATSEILRMRDVPPEFIAWLENVRKEIEEPCECPECCAERAKHPQLH
ncbi:TPA: hypothetical protein J0566_004111 [Salmonella enterica subsp. enterica serovar Virchow]|uniref:Uncharacterized protein n=1 Tax=Salmonella enterica TaxID=28901 RepID=A0A723XC09_SALER|nr:hypothetical protein [Salmonella enterica subsp. enterica serovar Infantis]HAD9903881.1 hypothetical protein [Salmonella enterica]HAZ2997050.1 hypothetical protein [Salmonella enterica subsp. enterica serovar Virchow]EBS1174840.1 hypothetical protein [Salmonella enterica subsp. enterica serovar Infantis]ECN4554472.1 hypothetical protein [Salmonella enterica subsp. enterica serovar Infantis]